MTFPTPVPPGWYPDPAKPGFERRWDGREWLGSSHKTPRRTSMLGPDYDRAFWSNANPAAGVGRWINLGSLLPLLVGTAFTFPENLDRGLFAVVMISACAIGFPSAVVAIVLASRGIVAAQRGAGAMGLSILLLISAPIALLGTLGLGTLAFVVGRT
jgi:hypothetical protein